MQCSLDMMIRLRQRSNSLMFLLALLCPCPRRCRTRVLCIKSHLADMSVRGQAIWAKGYTELLALMDADHARAGDAGSVPVDCYGSGEDLEEVEPCVVVD